MMFRRALRAVLVIVGTALCAVPVASPAQAAPGDAVASGSAGSARFARDGVSIILASVAPCSANGRPRGTTAVSVIQDVASFTDSASTCTVDRVGENASVEVTGGDFRFDALVPYGGPRLRLTDYAARCATTPTTSRASVEFAGLSGVDVPEPVPANHVVTIPGAAGAPPLATVTFHEVDPASTPRGATTVTLMHIRMFPAGGPATGEATVGVVHCALVA